MEKQILFKVVHHRYRYGSNITGFISNYDGTVDHQDRKEMLRFLPLPYRRRYLKGAKIKMIEGSPGICCFATRGQADSFIAEYRRLQRSAIVIQVLGTPCENQKVMLKGGCMNLHNLLGHAIEVIRPPYGTVFCSEVEVLD